MDEVEAMRHSLRRQAYDLKVAMQTLAEKLRPLHAEAAASADKSWMMAFEVWSHLATPNADDDDDHG